MKDDVTLKIGVMTAENISKNYNFLSNKFFLCEHKKHSNQSNQTQILMYY